MPTSRTVSPFEPSWFTLFTRVRLFYFSDSICSRKFIFVMFFMIVIYMFFMFQEVYFCTVLYDCNFSDSLCSRKFIFVLFFMIVISMFFMFQEVYFLFSMIVIYLCYITIIVFRDLYSCQQYDKQGNELI